MANGEQQAPRTISQRTWHRLPVWPLALATLAIIAVFGYLVVWPWAFERWWVRPVVANLTDEAGNYQKVPEPQRFGPKIAPTLLRLMTDEEVDARFRRNAAHAILVFNESPCPTQLTMLVRELACIMRDDRRPLDVRENAHWVLASIGPDARIVPDLIELAKQKDLS